MEKFWQKEHLLSLEINGKESINAVLKIPLGVQMNIQLPNTIVVKIFSELEWPG